MWLDEEILKIPVWLSTLLVLSEAGMFLENKVNSVAADAPATYIAKSSAVMVLTV